MTTEYFVICRLRTAGGFEAYGNFSLGGDCDFATELFGKLRGCHLPRETDSLHLDLVESRNGIPTNLQVISCTADEIAANCKVITKEMFKRLNLEQESRAG
ncbi:MAG TPA: hypothetical protein VHE34_03385 [Puia sp.]|uniref:hypothetical protein n=1 Tax=Puia sp. TaxID=2045100 RepID=UPI002BC70173|nr:hypothetical protein [Puia sp.]HVU94235.1 hypothetical protein [Puia sp.]